LPGTRAILDAISGSASSLPPFYFLLVRLFDQLLGPGEGAARIPSALAVAAGMFVTFDCARRFTNSVNALAGVAMLTCSLLPYYGYEARPYALCFLLSAIALWLWCHPRSEERFVAALFGLTFFVGFCLHYYVAFSLAPFAVYEVSRWRRLERPSSKLIAGTVGVIGGIVLCSPFMVAARRFSHGFWSPPSVTGLRDVFGELFPSILLVAAIALIGFALAPKRPGAVVPSMLPVERLGWLFLGLPVVGFALAVAVTNAFVSRYFIGMLPPVAVAFSCALWRRFYAQPSLSAAVAVLMLVVGAGQQVRPTIRPDGIKPPANPESPAALRAMLSLEGALLRDGKTVIVVPAGDTLALEAPHYSAHSNAYVLLKTNEDMLSRAHQDLARFTAITLWSMDDLHANARSAALINPSDAVLAGLTKAGFGLQFIDSGSYLLRVFYLRAPGSER
jgi:hypothetical protein